MKRLFTLKYQNGQLVINEATGKPYYFDNKMLAKAERDKRNAGFKIALGPDHWRSQK
jgi:hypothetical protein